MCVAVMLMYVFERDIIYYRCERTDAVCLVGERTRVRVRVRAQARTRRATRTAACVAPWRGAAATSRPCHSVACLSLPEVNNMFFSSNFRK